VNVPDHDTVDGSAELGRLMAEFFRAVSFRAGERPPYHLLDDLFLPDGRLINGVGAEPVVSTVEEFAAPRLQMVRAGVLTEFREWETGATTEIFGSVAHRLSGYGKEGVRNGEPFAARGLISTQFVRLPEGWRIATMAWDDEAPGRTVPPAYR
jgi:hypothetical protein